ncbi:tyrosine-type recombinase/integrase [Streptomyces sp. NPDC058762]|uniref:3'-5' exonuclease n=1 Tax=Streptomyces sp. NPDC058762 TaxID=3346629 RepID=UPI003694102F
MVFTRANETLGANWSLHDLRHAAAHRMVDDSKLNLTDIQWVLGHAQITTTQIYTEPRDEDVIERMRAHYDAPARAVEPPKAPKAPTEGYRQLFWKDLEDHHPGINSLQLNQQTVTAWKERLQTIRHTRGRVGKPRMRLEPILLAVRAFYLDIAQWAAHEPARWGPWVAPSPVPSTATQIGKERKGQIARMHQRTRTLEPGRAVVLDTETTALYGRTVEIAVIDAVTGKKLLDTLVNPGDAEISDGSRWVHGITDEMVADLSEPGVSPPA